MDNPTFFLTIASSLIATLFGLLVLIVGWLGNKIYDKLNEMAQTMNKISGELHERINGLDRRVSVVETKCEVNHHKMR